MRASLLLGLLLVSACGEVTARVDDAAIDSPGSCSPACGTNATCTGTTCACDPGFAGDGQTCTAIPRWEMIGSAATALDLGNNRGFMATAHATNIYFAPVSDPPQATTLRAFSTATLTLSRDLALPTGANDFEATGYGAIFVADADALYLIGDDARRYDPVSNVWTAVAGYGPGMGAFHRGESAGAWERNSNTIFMIGGRDDATNTYQGSALRRNANGTWAEEPGALPYTFGQGVAYAPPNGNLTYLAGGQTSDNNRRHFAVHTTGTSGWTMLPNTPEDTARAVDMGHFTADGVTRIFVATEQQLFFYNPMTMTWDRTIDLPRRDSAHVVMVQGVPHAIIKNGASAEIYKLVSIE